MSITHQIMPRGPNGEKDPSDYMVAGAEIPDGEDVVVSEPEDKSPPKPPPPKAEHRAPPWPKALNEMPGAGQLVVDYILAQSIRKSRPLAVSASLAIMSLATRNKYEAAPYGTGLNLYIVGVAPTGWGKDAGRDGIIAVANKLRLLHNISDDFASGQALLAALADTRLLLFIPDEYGMFLQAAGARGNIHIKSQVKELTALYTRARGVHTGKRYADASNNIPPITHPFVGVYGTTTRSALSKALSMDDVENGSLNRYLFVEVDKLPKRGHRHRDMPANVAAVVEDMRDTDPVSPLLPMTDGAMRILRDCEDEQEVELVRQVPTCDMWARMSENVIRVAGVVAVANRVDGPRIDTEHMVWARIFVRWCIDRVVHVVDADLSSSWIEARTKEVLAVIRNARDFGKTLGSENAKYRPLTEEGYMPRSLLKRKTRSLAGKDLDGIIQTLIESELIATAEHGSGGKRGPSTVMYWAV